MYNCKMCGAPACEDTLLEVRDLVETQALQTLVYLWRKDNPWAHSIPYDRFPQTVREQLESNAKILGGKDNAFNLVRRGGE